MGDSIVMTWTNTGFSDATTTGSYAWTATDGVPTGSSGAFDGLMIHPGLHKLYVRFQKLQVAGSFMTYLLQAPYSSTFSFRYGVNTFVKKKTSAAFQF